MYVYVKASTLKKPFLNSALQNMCVTLVSSIAFSKIYLNITLPVLPYKHDAFDLNNCLVAKSCFAHHEAVA